MSASVRYGAAIPPDRKRAAYLSDESRRNEAGVPGAHGRTPTDNSTPWLATGIFDVLGKENTPYFTGNWPARSRVVLLNWDGGTEEGMSLAAGTKLGPYEIDVPLGALPELKSTQTLIKA